MPRIVITERSIVNFSPLEEFLMEMIREREALELLILLKEIQTYLLCPKECTMFLRQEHKEMIDRLTKAMDDAITHI